MSKETEEGCGAVAGRVERPVRPCAWTLRTELDARETTCRANLWFSDPVNSAWAPLYDQAALDAAVAEANRRQNAAWKLMVEKMVAAERERWELHLSATRKLAEANSKRSDDCGMLARTLLYTLKAMGA